MRLVMFSHTYPKWAGKTLPQSAHILKNKMGQQQTLCGRDYPGVMGEPRQVTGQSLHLCGNCQSTLFAGHPENARYQ